jgi:hypothetical protein
LVLKRPIDSGAGWSIHPRPWLSKYSSHEYAKGAI